MLFRLIGTTIILGAITGFADSSEGEFSRRRGGQIVQGVFSIASFILVGAAYWRFGWKIGLIDLLLVIIASNVALGRSFINLYLIQLSNSTKKPVK